MPSMAVSIQKHYVRPEKLFGDEDLVMLPKTFTDDTQDAVPRIYGPFLEAHFHLVGESAHWKLYRRLGLNADQS